MNQQNNDTPNPDRKRCHTKDDHKVKEPPTKVQKYSNNPDVQVGTVRTLRNRTFAVPVVQPLSETLASNSSRVQRAVKKPKGKGFSKGTYGEETIVIPPKSCKVNSIDDDIPDLLDENGVSAPALPKTNRKKKGSASALGVKSADAKRMAMKRYY